MSQVHHLLHPPPCTPTHFTFSLVSHRPQLIHTSTKAHSTLLPTSHLQPPHIYTHLTPPTSNHLTPPLTSHHHSPHTTTHLTPPLTSHHHSSHTTSHLTPPLTSHHHPSHTTTHLTPPLTSHHHSPHTTTHLTPPPTSHLLTLDNSNHPQPPLNSHLTPHAHRTPPTTPHHSPHISNHSTLHTPDAIALRLRRDENPTGDKLVHAVDEEGDGALCLACMGIKGEGSALECVKLLLSAKASTTVPDHGRHPVRCGLDLT